MLKMLWAVLFAHVTHAYISSDTALFYDALQRVDLASQGRSAPPIRRPPEPPAHAGRDIFLGSIRDFKSALKHVAAGDKSGLPQPISHAEEKKILGRGQVDQFNNLVGQYSTPEGAELSYRVSKFVPLYKKYIELKLVNVPGQAARGAQEELSLLNGQEKKKYLSDLESLKLSNGYTGRVTAQENMFVDLQNGLRLYNVYYQELDAYFEQDRKTKIRDIQEKIDLLKKQLKREEVAFKKEKINKNIVQLESQLQSLSQETLTARLNAVPSLEAPLEVSREEMEQSLSKRLEASKKLLDKDRQPKSNPNLDFVQDFGD